LNYMQNHKKLIITVSSFLLIIAFFQYPFQVLSLNNTANIVKNNTWITERDNLNITIKLMPQVPIIDKITKISFEIRNLNNSKSFENMNAKVTMTDHDGRLYKFENKFIPIKNGQFSVDYIFPDDGEHRIILQLYKNITPFTVGSFEMLIPHPVSPLPSDNLLTPFFDFFNSFLIIQFR